MIVVDSSIWIEHLHVSEPLLDEYLLRENALMHPHVLGEVAIGSIRNRGEVLARFRSLPVPHVAGDGHVLTLIDRWSLWSTGVGYTDAHLLASAFLTPDARLWTRDKRLRAQAERLGFAADHD